MCCVILNVIEMFACYLYLLFDFVHLAFYLLVFNVYPGFRYI